MPGSRCHVFFRSDGTEYGTSELESIAWRRVDDVSETRVHESGEVGLPCFFGTTVLHGVSTGCSQNYPSGSARTLS